MFRFTKKRLAVGLGAVGALVLAAGAYAYFTSTGTATGTASVGTATTWNVTSASESSSLYPYLQTDLTGNASLYTPLTGGKVQNMGSGRQNLNTIVATISSVNNSGSIAGDDACVPADFRLYSPGSSWTLSSSNLTATINPNTDLAPHGSSGDTYSMSDLSIAMVDDGTVQDNCQNASPQITYNAS